ncbi:hypothetical protein FA15DRAFT_704504 [Coprinopsis marcescibilis]|uniref:G domain-containing protein n=1 Tax=Coprinopsis marcescibilis TaxID=230819 RepID=A0A5C3KVQ8_COPMA|nr:hypothetical protein FA15DRAFT_704504 [Coprinopsis marcescibilis]
MSSREAFEDADNLRLRPNGQKFLILLGETGSGKSTFVNQCLSNLGVSEERYADVGSSSGIQSVTKNVTFYPALSEGHSSSGLNWNLVDTPGFDNSDTSLDDEEIKNMIVRTLGAQGSRTRKCAVIYFQSTRGLGTSSPFFHTLEREIRTSTITVECVTLTRLLGQSLTRCSKTSLDELTGVPVQLAQSELKRAKRAWSRRANSATEIGSTAETEAIQKTSWWNLLLDQVSPPRTRRQTTIIAE